MEKISRRSFLKKAAAGLFFAFLGSGMLRRAFARNVEESYGRKKSGIKGDYDLVLAEGANPYANTVKAVEAMGGMKRFVKKDAVVVIKPNIGWDRTPEQAANTDPEVVAALVDLCLKAGAKRVNVFDVTCNDPRRCYVTSGIEKRAKEKGANVYHPDDWNVVKAKFNYKSPMENWTILRDAVMCDTFINVPVLKHHSLAGLTLSMKNLMGVCTGNRGLIHIDIGRKVVDLTDFISPDLTIIDAHRVLLRHGPTGGDLKDVVQMNKLIAATDPTLADAFACRLLKIDPMNIPNLKAASVRNFGSSDINKAKILDLKIS